MNNRQKKLARMQIATTWQAAYTQRRASIDLATDLTLEEAARLLGERNALNTIIDLCDLLAQGKYGYREAYADLEDSCRTILPRQDTYARSFKAEYSAFSQKLRDGAISEGRQWALTPSYAVKEA